MNPHKYFVSADLISNPLCGIGTYKDTLDLATGQITRKIKKLELDGTELWQFSSSDSNRTVCYINQSMSSVVGYCSHILWKSSYESSDYNRIIYLSSQGGLLYISLDNALLAGQTLQDFILYLQQQYAAGTPVTIWYVLETSETEQISVPSGLSGTLEGLLTQSGTPTPLAPIYPTAVTGEGWYNINTYIRSVLVWNTDTAYERDSGAWT